jgi:hypothetical protein
VCGGGHAHPPRLSCLELLFSYVCFHALLCVTRPPHTHTHTLPLPPPPHSFTRRSRGTWRWSS